MTHQKVLGMAVLLPLCSTSCEHKGSEEELVSAVE